MWLKSFRICATVVVFAAMVGCRSGDSTASSARLTFRDGAGSLPVPLSARRDPVVAVIGRSIVVFGGLQRAGTTQVRWLDDGAVYDLDTHEWRPMASAPFRRAPYGTTAAASSNALVVVGTPCGITDGDMETAACPGAVSEVASYRPSTDRWSSTRAIRFPPEASDLAQRTAKYGVPLLGAARGWLDGGVIIALEESQARVLKVHPDGAAQLVDAALANVAPPNSSPVTASLEEPETFTKPTVRIVG